MTPPSNDGSERPAEATDGEPQKVTDGGLQEASAERGAPPGEYGILPRRLDHPVDDDERQRLYEEYGRVRTYFKLRPNDHLQLQRWLTQARIPATYDQYLARTVYIAVIVGLVGGVLGLLLTWLVASTGTLGEIRTGFSGPIAVFVSQHRAVFAALVLIPLFGSVFAAATWYARYYHPSVIVSSRRQNINIVLPHAIVYMYALSYGGMGLLEAIESLAEAEETYGEVAREFELVRADMELFGSDLYTALRNARNLTPSDNFEQFLDDMLSVLESGGDMSTFFGEESSTYLREAEEQQEGFLETLSLLSELFIFGFVATPLFLIVTLVVMSFIGGGTIDTISLLVYLILPLASVAFLFLLDVLNQPYEQIQTTPLPELGDTENGGDDSDERFDEYRSHKRRIEFRQFLDDPLETVKSRPLLSLAVSVPLAVALAGGLVLVGAVTPTVEGMRTAPVRTTIALFVLPFLVATVPLSAFYEYRQRRDNQIAGRFPDTLNILSSANRMGIPLTEALDLVTRWSTGPLAEELRTVRNDIEWNHDTTTALLSFGERLRVPQLARTMKLLADGLRSSGDLSRVLSIAAEDTRNRDRLERARRRELSTYIVVVVIGFLVYLMVLLMLEASFLRPLDTLNAGSPDDAQGPVSLIGIPVETYRMMFFHSSLIMGAGSGFIAGKLADNNTLSGLKYAILLVAFTLVAFTLI
jgi:flagellar protein FlaJ